MSHYIEKRRLSATALRALCIEHGWYTAGDNDSYDHLLQDLASDKPHLGTDDIIAIAEDIAAHSDLEEGEGVPAIAFEVARACSVAFERLPELADGLPELCFSVLRSTGELICIKRGESGYYRSCWSTDDPAQNRELADFNNWKLGVTHLQRLAMETGSMHGWDVPGADPRSYEKAPSVPEELAAAARQAVDERVLPKLMAVLEAAGCTEPEDVAAIAGQLDEYILEPEHRTYEDIARSDLRAVAGEPAMELLVPHVDLDAYGRAVAGNMNLVLTSYGAVSRRDCQPIRTADGTITREDV